jgi:hypothetical protein
MKVLVILTCMAAFAADPSVSVESNVYSHYVWRGLAVNLDPVLQTSGTVFYRGGHLNVFANQDLTAISGRRGKVNELDFDGGYDYTREKYTLSAGAIHYTFPNTMSASTTEIYGGAAFGGWLHPSFRGYFDTGANGGQYATADVYHSFALPRLIDNTSWAAVLSAGAGWGSSKHNAGYYGVETAALADLHPSLAVPITRGPFRVTPRLGYSHMLDAQLRRGPAAVLHGFYAGLGLSYTR